MWISRVGSKLEQPGKKNTGSPVKYALCNIGGSVVKNRLPMQKTQEMWVQSLGREDPLGKEMAPHSSLLAWKIPWIEEPGRLQSMELQRVRHDLAHSHSDIILGTHLR